MRSDNTGIIWGVIVVLGIIASVVSMFLFGHSDQDCIDHANAYDIPCIPGTINWDEDECECQSTQGTHEIEFELPGGCNFDD